MSQAYTGGCACGAIRYEITAEPRVSVECHCRDCQKESGTGHGSHLTFERKDVRLEGKGKGWEMTADSGRIKTRFFCADCGTPVYMTFAAMPEVFSVRAGSLDDPARYQPQLIVYRARAHAWDHMNPQLPAFEGMPGPA